MQVSAKKLITVNLCILLFLSIGMYAFAATPTTTFWVTPGVYPGAPSFTIWRESSNYFAKASSGSLGIDSTNGSAVYEYAIANGDDLFFEAGTYILKVPLNYDSGTSIIGAGRGVTIFQLENGVNIVSSLGMIQPDGYGDPVPDQGYFCKDVYFAHFSIDGNKAGNPSGVYQGIVANYVPSATIYDVEAYNCKETGINAANIRNATSVNQPILITGCYAHDNDADGFQIGAGSISDSFSWDNGGSGFNVVRFSTDASNERHVASLVNCEAYNNLGSGFSASAQSGDDFPIEFTGCSSLYNDIGFSLGVAYSSVIGGLSEFNDKDGVHIGNNHTRVIDVEIRNNDQNQSEPSYNGHSGIYVIGTNHNVTIRGNNIYDDQATKTQDYGIDFYAYGAGVNCIIEHNNLDGNNITNLANAPAEWIIRFNIGFTTENSSSSSVSTGGTVTHGLAGTPTTVLVTAGESGPTDLYVSAVGANTFAINFGGGGTKLFYWRAEYDP